MHKFASGADVNAKDNSGKTAIHDGAYAHTGKLWKWFIFWIVLLFFDRLFLIPFEIFDFGQEIVKFFFISNRKQRSR